uniref:Uncharacterized protein n=1 Tax=Picea glauca TaxID=3330 RepID=A0A101LX98_PICGL|nr:hypothetical protein ABT39_MTgene6065 [Picea glauca]
MTIVPGPSLRQFIDELSGTHWLGIISLPAFHLLLLPHLLFIPPENYTWLVSLYHFLNECT